MFFNGYVIILHLWMEISALLMFIFILNRSKLFRQTIINDSASLSGKIMLSFAFGLIGVFGSYWGIPVVNGVPDMNAFGNAFSLHWVNDHVDGIANTRAVGVIVGGLIGGPLVGIGAGLIAGIHRIYIFTTFSSFISGTITIGQGILAGFIHQKVKNKREQWRYGLAVGLASEVVHMLLLFAIGQPAERAKILVYAIMPAMLITNSIGVAAFIGLLETGLRDKESTEALAAKLALSIANKTMTFLRAGLDETSASEAARIIYGTVGSLGAVAITSRERVLAFVGTGDEFYSNSVVSPSIARVLETGEYGVYQKKTDSGCVMELCLLASHVVVPLRVDKHVIGSLVLYKFHENGITLFETELACGLAELISTQLEISKGERQAKLLASAEIKALQAQINPHFLFNALNTIGYYCRKQPDVAKKLIVHLGNYYRNNLAGNDAFVPLQKEIQCVDDYVKIEMARFEGRMKVYYQIDPACDIDVPPLILQPLVENAIKHGINPKENGGNIWIFGKQDANAVELIVEDDGVGMEPELAAKVLKYDPGRKSIGLNNVNQRLISVYGPDSKLRIESRPNIGTRVSLSIPRRKECAHAS
jgi:two-component system sensor histidine kinase LytS